MTTLMHRTLAAAILGVGASVIAPAVIAADNFPNQPIRWIVPFPPGGAMDNIARTLSEPMGKKLGQTIVVENRAGAGGNIGASAVARAKPDGHTIMIAANGMAVNPALYPNMNYDPIKDFEPISLLAVVPNILVTNTQKDTVKTIQDVIKLAKEKPGHYTFASAGVGTSIHLAGELFVKMAEVDMLHIPYKGSGPAITDLLGGQVDYMWDSITSAKPHVESGKLRAIAVSTADRSTAMPDLPTVAESGVPGYALTPWFATFAPAKTPAPIIEKLHKAMTESLQDPKVQETLKAIGAETIGSSSEELAKYLAEESVVGQALIRERGITMQ
ncbi:MAG: tripartite tricarboxylate transporter substrate binding protein [Pigmentiphaga sp.]|nr:tripartite tricarboxylate transporter substrate binding protein [Pigmentiphaga sp.]